MKPVSILTTALLAAISLPAHAVLGGTPSIQMTGETRGASDSLFSVRAQKLASGTIVREFVSTAGNRVFAVAWDGPFMPDLQQWLGSNFEAYADAASAPHSYKGHRPVEVQTPGMVVHSGGRMRAFRGFAYLPGQLPNGFMPENIR